MSIARSRALHIINDYYTPARRSRQLTTFAAVYVVRQLLALISRQVSPLSPHPGDISAAFSLF